MATKTLRNVVLAGASGNIGKAILEGLLAAGHKVTVLTRPESSTAALLSSNLITVHRGDYHDEAFLANALHEQDVLITALAFTGYDAQRTLFTAAARAGVPWIVPCEFGSDPHAPLNEHIDLMRVKRPYRALVEELGVSAWIGVVTNPWFDLMLALGGAGFGVDMKARTASLFDEGTAKVSLTTRRRVGKSLAAVLALPEEELAALRNGWVYFSSFRVSQRELWESAVRATGTKEGDWRVEYQSSDEMIRQSKATMGGEDPKTLGLLMALTFAEGMGGDYQEKVVDYERLGLEPEESLDEAVKEVAGLLLGSL